MSFTRSCTLRSALLNAAAVVIAWLIAFSLFLVLCGLSSCRSHRQIEAQGVNISEVASAQIGTRRTALLATSFPLQIPVNLFGDSTQKPVQGCTASRPHDWVLAIEETSSQVATNAAESQSSVKQSTPHVLRFKLLDYVCIMVALLGVIIAAIWFRRRRS